MKTLAIDMMNEERDNALVNEHNLFINKVNESGLPLWMSDQYDNYQHLLDEQQEEVESPIYKKIMDSYIGFVHSELGEKYHHMYGNWDDAYQQYREHSINPV